MRRSSILAGLCAGILIPALASAQNPPGQPPAGRGNVGGFRGGITIKPGEECPPGTTEVRPRNCLGPEGAVPSILDYRPRSTLVAPTHMVPKAKFPVVDFHGHPQQLLSSTESLSRMQASLDSLNVRTMIAADNVSGDRLKRVMDTVRASATMKDRVRVLAGINFGGVGPGWAAKAVAQLEEDVKHGAVGVGEIPKSLGLTIKKPDGSRLKIDDPELDPIWDACARLNLTVFIHTADPEQFFKPLDYKNERWLEQSLFPERRYPQDKFPSFETLVQERNNLFKRHPKTRFVTAHMGWHTADLATLGRLFDENPNVYGEIGAVLYDIGRQPRAAHDFFVKYQDRILFGKDSFQPEEYPYYWRVLETKDDYFDYYRDYHAFWKLYGIDLPDVVLKKVYYQNALKMLPLVPTAGFPK